MSKEPRSPLGLMALIVFLDIVGFSILFPLFPAMLEHYVALEGASSWIGELAAKLQEVAGEDQNAVLTLFGGVLGSLYAFLQFLFAPVWGGLSDRIGRRPTLLFTLAGTVVGYAIWIFAGSFALLIASRCVGGIMAGNISTATAVVADTTTGKKRAAGMGIVGASIGLGFLFGPALGGTLWSLQLGSGDDWQLGFAWNPFSVPALAACGLAVLNFVWVAARFHESLPKERRGSDAGEARAHVLNPFGQLKRIALPGVPRTNVVYFLFLTAFSAMEFTLVFLVAERLGYGPSENRWMFVFIGIVIALVQGGVVRRVAPRVGEKKVILLGLALLVPGFLLVAWTTSALTLYAGLTFMAVGSALAMPCLSSLVSRYSPEDRQGLVLGTFRSMGSLSRAVGPILGGVLYWRLGAAAPYWMGALFLLLPLALSLGLPPVPPNEEAAGAEPETA